MNTNALFKIGYGLYLITTNKEGYDNGCIVNTFVQITSEPLKVLLGVNKQNYTCDIIKETGLFNACVLNENAAFSTYQRFGFQSGRDTDKCENFPATRSQNGLLVPVNNCNAFIGCKVTSMQDFGSHILFAADVTEAEILNEVPTATYAYYFDKVKPKPAPPKEKGIKGWRCKICGYVYEGEELPADFTCPICKHGPSDFEPVLL